MRGGIPKVKCSVGALCVSSSPNDNRRTLKGCAFAAFRGGHNATPDHKFKVYISGQGRRVTETIKRELRRRSAVEPVIGHSKAEHRMGRNYLAGTHGDAANAVLAAAGYNLYGHCLSSISQVRIVLLTPSQFFALLRQRR
jgi:hypothetical protein